MHILDWRKPFVKIDIISLLLRFNIKKFVTFVNNFETLTAAYKPILRCSQLSPHCGEINSRELKKKL